MTDLQDGYARNHALTAVLDRSRAVASSRKLVRDIELTLKKVYDGISLFNEIGQKMEAAEVRLHAKFLKVKPSVVKLKSLFTFSCW